MQIHQNHPFHIVDKRPWPILRAIIIIIIITGTIKWFQEQNINLLSLRRFTIILISYLWWRDITRERTFQGNHTIIVMIGLRWGIILFILSEIIFFISFFWRFFHRRLVPNIELGINWPPKRIQPFNPSEIPLLNTLILLTSGLTVTWTHHRLIENNLNQSIYRLILTAILGFYFLILQIYEYYQAPFSLTDSIYGTTFFITTGFHGIHVLIGSTFLTTCLIRLIKNQFSPIHHFGFEAAAWYWHFVDVVWLLLYLSIYWWRR